MNIAEVEVLGDVHHHVSRHFNSLADVLEGILRAILERANLNGGTLRLQDVGTLTVRRDASRVTAWWNESWEPPAAIDPDMPAGLQGGALALSPEDGVGGRVPGRGLEVPIVYAGLPIGELWLDLPGDSAVRASARPSLEALARQCGFLAQRFAARRWSIERFGRPLLLVGMSPALRGLEAFLERAAGSALPVLLSGEFGTEKALVAAAIHACGPRRDGPFVQVHCAEPEGTPADWLELADGGTLLLSDVDELQPRFQNQLPQRLHSRLDQRLDLLGMPMARIIATTTADLSARVRDGTFSRTLLAELDFLSATVPPVRERDGDMRALLAAALERHGHRPEERLSDDLVQMCGAYSWPENLYELERVVARLAVLGEGGAISRADVQRHAPWLVEGAHAKAVLAPMPPAAPASLAPPTETLPVPAPPAEPPASGPERWVNCAITRDPGELSRLHPGLRRALVHLGQHYAEPVSVDQLARHAHVSPSHLSYLFRSELGTSSKALLGRIRIHKAREILRAEARKPITEVALQVGFADLSHFEKSFRKVVGKSPREFRRGA